MPSTTREYLNLFKSADLLWNGELFLIVLGCSKLSSTVLAPGIDISISLNGHRVGSKGVDALHTIAKGGDLLWEHLHSILTTSALHFDH